ncbi:MAG: TetR/AcrR family transcriptional regulator [Mycobacteriaceae bacterium]|nr:TetR/AcrR family transcriptional regulator [Mycobacteriaceae bacterium]MBV9637984.1 TetR/AcrR family transcriptional regulator [Mycobacteriaceae bacterium]
MTQQAEAQTRDAIIAAAFACFRTGGLRKTTIVDIARTADISRSTFYEYFPDKGAVIEACAEAASQRFYRNMAKVVNRADTLEDQLVGAAVFVVQARRIVEPQKYFDQEQVDLLMTKNAAVLLQECTDFVAPYLVAAKLTGEVRKDLDATAAGEWFARILFSLFTTPSPHIDTHDDQAVGEFVRAFVVRGFTDDRAARLRRAAAG